jgi:hypothetical protein
MSENETGPILCGKCHVAPERGFERDGQMWASCPVCGQEDTIEYIGREGSRGSSARLSASIVGSLDNMFMTPAK